MFCFFILICIVHIALCTAATDTPTELDPTCRSRFDYDYKLFTKLVTLEAEMAKLKEKLRDTSPEQNRCGPADVSSLDGPGTTYTRWGSASCPGNGTELVYYGYAGGSRYDHRGGAAEYICLPKDPTWGNYEDEVQHSSALVYGAEYELEGRYDIKFFGKEVHDKNAPCAVCRTKRSSMIMIPARNQCYHGWTTEYHGYLTGGFYGHKSASEFVCLDVEAENVPNSNSNENGKLFFFTEAKCGSLPCPPYVNGRELTCVVCSK